MPALPLGAPVLVAPAVSDEPPMDPNVIDLQRWRDFNDAPAQPEDEPFMHLDPEPAQTAIFFDVVFGYLEGFIPLRGFIDKGQGAEGKPHNPVELSRVDQQRVFIVLRRGARRSPP